MATSYLASTVRALVHLGRPNLAEALKLRIPTTVSEEREMWTLAAAFRFYPYNPRWAGKLDRYRDDSGEGQSSSDAGSIG